MKFYNYIYSNLYRWAKGLSYDDSPEYTAFFSICFLVFCNVGTAFGLVRIIIGHPLELPEINKLLFLPLVLIVSIPQWLYLIYNKRYVKIISSYKSKNQTRDTVKTWLYIILSIGFLFLTMYILIIQNRQFL